MDKAMIDWTKPIETVDGREARVIAHLPDPPAAGTTDERFFVTTMVWIASDKNGFGDVFLVNNRGVGCDDRALFSRMQEPIIRNTPVKREGWVNIYGVYETEEEAKSACVADSGRQRFVTWEE